MIKLGLTGSIGMGKSETARMFRDLGVPVFDSDAIVHELMGIDGEAVDLVEDAFPGVKNNNQIDRKELGKRVFGDDGALIKLEKIIHPMVSNKRDEFVEMAKIDGHDVVVFDIPLLYEKSYETLCDYVVVVSAPASVQRERVLARPDMTEKRFAEILSKQVPDNEKREKADFIVQSDQGFDYAERQVKEILEKVSLSNA
ncbi:dephospho-CoA kinase [Pseudemcibacter aquimaris]|uniref:dephospho-CoA kinase n=1 Tax=Pseudemcibacter aquimaris TaxID=2857064 RepID=UPI0020122535|nr:dephospho-CoA kinase [Pseudemcibacter aquimaris]MCC3861825.1 dephospho-CoA kinase [Pseudemcibacter aquimaris]WDU58580.1 dephospho-CoA kinase [Pseudemcibacter aquimaris]